MIKASIDIGTNTVLLLVAEKTPDGLQILEEQQRIPRLGRGVDKSRNLSKHGMDRVSEVLLEYKQLLSDKYPMVTSPIVTATSAVRDANNRSYFLKRIKTQTGLSIQILSGEQEAEYTFQGAKSMLPGESADNPLLVLDIGGGSTEMALGEGHKIQDRYSFDMGCVRFTERYFNDTTLSPKNAVTACKKEIQTMLQEHSFDLMPETKLVGVSGTITSLAFMDQGLEEYEKEQIDGYFLSKDKVSQFIEWISQLSSQELIDHYPVVMEGRADIFLAGLIILEEIMNYYQLDVIIATTGGVQHGAIMISS